MAKAAPLVLVVDDYDDGREMYAEYLMFLGYRVVEAANGVQALEQAARARPDVVILDLSLPSLDGREVLRRLRTDPRSRNSIIVILTGSVVKGVAEEMRASGADLYLAKPCLPSQLGDAIAGLLADRARLRPTA